MKRMIAFDLDGTLAESKQPLGDAMAALLARLLEVGEVAIISGGDWPQFQKQVVARLPGDAAIARLWIMPTTGAKLYRYRGGAWGAVYADLFTPDERARIRDALDAALAGAGELDARIWGERIEDRGSQITFSGLGQDAPLDAKAAWDPDRAKRAAMQTVLAAALPGFSIKLGGTTSIDITRVGVDKAYGMRRLADASGVTFDEILFLGDAVYEGGNDHPVIGTGIDVVGVRDVRETQAVVAAVIACLAAYPPASQPAMFAT